MTETHPRGTFLPPTRFRKQFWGSLMALGISSVSVQLVTLREIMSSLGGNESVIGLVLGLWLLFTAMGSGLGAWLPEKAKPERLLFWGHLAIAVLPFLQIGAVRAFPLLWVRGAIPGLAPAICLSSLILLPYCLTAGAMIPVVGALDHDKKSASRVYVVDTMGDITGGLLFSLAFVYLLSHWESLMAVAILNLAAAGLIMPRHGLLLTFLCLCLPATQILDIKTLSWRFPGQHILVHKNTPFAQLTITTTGRQHNVFQDATPLFSTNDLEREAKAHLSMTQVGKNARVLLIAGGVFGTIEEIIKHDPRRIDYVELDPAILELDDALGQILTHPAVHVHVGDGRLFVKQTKEIYDVVIVDLPGPENAQLNRFYSLGFFEEIHTHLRPHGILLFSLTGAENYLEERGLALNRPVLAALKEAFRQVVVFPGMTHYYLASDGPLTTDIASILAERAITTKRLVDYDLTAMTDPMRMDRLRKILDEKTVAPNKDLSPRAFGAFMDLWLKKTGSPGYLPFVLAMATVVFSGITCRHGRIPFTIMTSGFSAMTLELSILLLFQVIYGYVYLRMCLIVTLFMIGSATGACVEKKAGLRPDRALTATDLVLALTAVAGCGAAQSGIGWESRSALFLMQAAVIPGLILMGAFAVGFQFSAAARATSGTGSEVLGRLYLADLAGAACGTVLTGLVLVPKIGIVGVLSVVVILKMISFSLNVSRDFGGAVSF